MGLLACLPTYVLSLGQDDLPSISATARPVCTLVPACLLASLLACLLARLLIVFFYRLAWALAGLPSCKAQGAETSHAVTCCKPLRAHHPPVQARQTLPQAHACTRTRRSCTPATQIWRRRTAWSARSGQVPWRPWRILWEAHAAGGAGC